MLICFLLGASISFGQEDWQQRGGGIDGEAAGDASGFSVSLSSDGSVVAIGAPQIFGDASGYVRIYEWSGTDWQQRGGDIDGEAAGDASGFSVSLSSDGSVVAIGAPQIFGDTSGYVRIYEWSGTDWQQRGGDIDGEAAGDASGFSVSLSSDGSVVAIGAPQIFGDTSGYVRFFSIDQKQDECDTEALISAVITLTEQLAQKDAQIAQLEGRPTQAAYDQVVQELNARPTLDDIQEARAGSVILTPTANGTVILRMMIEESSDLSVWEQNGESVEVELPLAEGKKFLRFAFPAGN